MESFRNLQAFQASSAFPSQPAYSADSATFCNSGSQKTSNMASEQLSCDLPGTFATERCVPPSSDNFQLHPDHDLGSLASILKEDNAEVLNATLRSGGQENGANMLQKVAAVLHHAVKADAVSCLAFLLEWRTDDGQRLSLDHLDDNGVTCLRNAAVNGSVQCLELLLRRRANPELICKDGKRAVDAVLEIIGMKLQPLEIKSLENLFSRVNIQELNVVRLLFKHSGDARRLVLDLTWSGIIEKFGALLLAVGDSLVNMVFQLNGEDTALADMLVDIALLSAESRVSAYGWRLSREVAMKELELIALWRPNLNRTDERPQGFRPDSIPTPPIIKAARAVDADLVRILINGGASVLETDSQGDSGLHCCLRSSAGTNLIGVVWKLIEAGSSVSLGNNDGMTPVHIAAQFGHSDPLKIMVAREPAAVHLLTVARETALFWAVRGNHTECVKILLVWGADRLCTNFRGERPWDVATEEGRRLLEMETSTGPPDSVAARLQQLAMHGARCSLLKTKRKKGRSIDFDLPSAPRFLPPPKTELCRYYRMAGGCVRGDACLFAHGERELLRHGGLSDYKVDQQLERNGSFKSAPYKQNPDELGKKIFVGGLSPSVESEDLREYFEEHFGPVVDAVVIGSQSGDHVQSRGFGFVTFKYEQSVTAAVKEHYVILFGKKVEIKSAIPRPLMIVAGNQVPSVSEQKKALELSCSLSPNSCESFNSSGQGSANCESSVTDESGTGEGMEAPPVYEGPPPPWLIRLREWLPTFLQQVSSRLKEGEWYPLSSLKGDFRATCGMELDHLTIGYPKLSDFVRSLADICRMKIVPVGRGPATHMVLLPPVGQGTFGGVPAGQHAPPSTSPHGSGMGDRTSDLEQPIQSFMDKPRFPFIPTIQSNPFGSISPNVDLNYGSFHANLQASAFQMLQKGQAMPLEAGNMSAYERLAALAQRMHRPSSVPPVIRGHPEHFNNFNPTIQPPSHHADPIARPSPSAAEQGSLGHEHEDSRLAFDILSFLNDDPADKPGSLTPEVRNRSMSCPAPDPTMLKSLNMFNVNEMFDQANAKPFAFSGTGLLPMDAPRPVLQQFVPLAAHGNPSPGSGQEETTTIDALSKLQDPFHADVSAFYGLRDKSLVAAEYSQPVLGNNTIDSARKPPSHVNGGEALLLHKPLEPRAQGAYNMWAIQNPHGQPKQAPMLSSNCFHPYQSQEFRPQPPTQVHTPWMQQQLPPMAPGLMRPPLPVSKQMPLGQNFQPCNLMDARSLLPQQLNLLGGGEEVCMVCWERRALWLALPCGHRCTCTVCKDVLQQRGGGHPCCARCKIPVERWMAL
ncbi:hypothetical protein CLOM_g4060 [Closterium sp. NIES-68]|nr:hypothetical protein CLOM_g4060 [Closterium sp. NIES-68]GJP73201.1 hypothetical protein CLOP_g3941 [Closterium sp. NIES-67]